MEEYIIEGTKESVEELIIRITKGIPGVGKATAGFVSADFDGNLKAFFSADVLRMQQIKNSSGRQVLKPEQVDELLTAKSVFQPDMGIQEAWVFYLGRKFLKAQIDMVRALHFNNFDINPLLAKALSLDEPRKVIAFNVYQTVTRSVVTSWGDTVEEIAKFVGCKENDYAIEGKTGTNFDLVKEVDGIDYHIQVKSGPNTMNVGMVTSLNEAIEKIEQVKPNAKGMLGMTYGTRNRISNQIMGNLKDADLRMKIGREFWDFISGRNSFHKDLFRLLDASSQGILNNSFIELIEAKIDELAQYWESEYPGMQFDEVLEHYI